MSEPGDVDAVPGRVDQTAPEAVPLTSPLLFEAAGTNAADYEQQPDPVTADYEAFVDLFATLRRPTIDEEKGPR